MFAKVLRRPKFVVLPNGAGMMLRAVVGIWAVKAQSDAGLPPRVKECFTFDIDMDSADKAAAVRDRLRALVRKFMQWFGSISAEQRRQIPRDNTDRSLERIETEQDDSGLLAAVASLEGEEAES